MEAISQNITIEECKQTEDDSNNYFGYSIWQGLSRLTEKTVETTKTILASETSKNIQEQLVTGYNSARYGVTEGAKVAYVYGPAVGSAVYSGVQSLSEQFQ